MIKIRPYQPGDAHRIFELFSRHSPYLRNAAFWLWINRIWPDASSIAVVAEEDGEILGHYAIVPKRLAFGGMTIKGGLGIHAFIAPEARGRVPIFQISKKCYQLAKEAGIQLVWGFPNANYRLIQEKVEGWICVDLFKAYEKKISRTRSAMIEMEPIDIFDPVSALRLNDSLELIPSHFGC